jgi:hypothetical protein
MEIKTHDNNIININLGICLKYINNSNKIFNVTKLDNISNELLLKIYIGKYIEYGIIPNFVINTSKNKPMKYY